MRPAITFRQLCAIARAEARAGKGVQWAHWVEGIKCRVVRLGFAYPKPHELTAAMSAVEHEQIKAWQQRPR